MSENKNLIGCFFCLEQFPVVAAHLHTCDGAPEDRDDIDDLHFCTTCGATWLYWKTGTFVCDHNTEELDEAEALFTCGDCSKVMPFGALEFHTHQNGN